MPIAIGPKFERRHYEALHREALVPAIGNTAIASLRSEELARLKKRRKTELQSSLAEAMKPEQVRTIIDTHYPIEMVDGKLVAEDGEPIEDMLQRALEADRQLAESDEFFAPFLVDQTQYEVDELHEWEAMARGETDHNTCITFSGYTEEHDDGSPETHAKLIRAGKKPYWRRGMFRVAYARGGKLHVFNYSIDNCSVELMTEVAAQELNYEFKARTSNDMLSERIPLQIEDGSWRFLAPRLVAHGDRFLSKKYGGIWKHGYNPQEGIRRAQAYVESQDQIVNSLLAVDQGLAFEHASYESYEEEFMLEFYDCIALLEKRLELGRENEPIVDYAAAAGGAGSIARAEGKVYDACGMAIGVNGLQPTHASAATKTGFESLKRLENTKINCRACKEKVKVPKKDLDKGMLSCGECGYWLNVCTGASGFKKSQENLVNRSLSGFDILAAGWHRIGAQLRCDRYVVKRKTAQTGNEKRQLDSIIKLEEAKIEQLRKIA